jgi:hypothetical protein
MRVENLVCDHCRKPALALMTVEDTEGELARTEVCPNCLPAVVSDAVRADLVAVRLEFAQPVAAPVRMRARR